MSKESDLIYEVSQNGKLLTAESYSHCLEMILLKILDEHSVLYDVPKTRGRTFKNSIKNEIILLINNIKTEGIIGGNMYINSNNMNNHKIEER